MFSIREPNDFSPDVFAVLKSHIPIRPVDTFITYDGKRASDIAAPRYAVRHLVAAMVS